MEGWVKIYRELVDWEWFSSSKHVHVFIYFLLRANHKSKNYRGETIPEGSFTTSLAAISNATGLSVRKIRTVLKDLKTTNEVTSSGNSKRTMITIVNWEKYQSSDTQDDNQTTIKRQSNDSQTTTNKNEKNEKNEKNNIYLNQNTDRVGVSWNNLCDQIAHHDKNIKLPKVKLPLSEKRKKHVKLMLKELPDDDQWKTAMIEITGNEFNLGKNDRGWIANFDWFIKPTTQNYLKYYELGMANEN